MHSDAVPCRQMTATGRYPGYDREKMLRIREKIRVVFGKESALDDAVLSKRYNLTDTGDLIMILG